MVNLMRTNQRWMMIIVSVLASVSLIWFYSDRSSVNRGVSNRVGSIYGRGVTLNEFGRIERELQVARSLGTLDLLRATTGDGNDADQAPVNYLVLEHEAERLGISPTAEEIRAAGEKLPAFRGANGEYDQAKYNDFVSREIFPRGLSPSQIDDLVRMNLAAAKLRALVTAPVVVSAPEARTAYDELHAKTEASIIRLKSADLAAVAEPTEDEIKKYYTDQKNQFMRPERRQVQYVKFGLDETQARLTGKARVDALKPLADRAVAFLEKLLDQKGKEDFRASATAEQLTVKETPDFEEEQATGFEESTIPQFTQAAFALTSASPDSDVPLQTDDAFYDLHLANVTPTVPLTLEEARPKVVAAIKAEHTKTALAAKAEEIRTKITADLKAGRSFADAAKDAGRTAEEVPPFSLMEPDRKLPDASEIAGVAEGLTDGEVSPFVPGGDGGLLVYVRARVAPEEAKFEAEKNTFALRIQSNKSLIYFIEWLRSSRDAADARFNVRSQG